MDPFTIAAVIGLLGSLYLIFVLLLLLSMILDFFRTKAVSSPIKATFQEHLSNGQYKTIAAGLSRSFEVEEAIGYKSDDVDSDLYNAHQDSEIVVWT